MKYSVAPAERIRQDLKLNPRQFSVRIDYDPQAYPLAVERGYLTQRMAKEISRRWKIPLSDFEVIDGNTS